jgi:hypothetical protein
MGVNMNWIRQKLELHIIIIKPAQFDNTGSEKDRIGGPPKDRHSDHSGQI